MPGKVFTQATLASCAAIGVVGSATAQNAPAQTAPAQTAPAQTALAQTAPNQAAPDQTVNADVPAQTDTSRTSAQIGDIVVTAQRRAENVQKSALSIEALDSAALADRGVKTASALNGVVTGLSIAPATGGQNQIYIRGVGDQTGTPAVTQQAVSINVDGVGIARSVAFGSIFFDISRVEVLRGPQGTLYGRNSSGGAINIISNAPRLDVLGGSASVEVGNYDLFRVEGALNVPVSDTLALRFAGQRVKHNGYLSDGANDDDTTSGRARALWKPSDDFSILLTAERSHTGGVGAGRTFRPSLFGAPWTGSNDQRLYDTQLYPTLFVHPIRPTSTDITSTGFTSEINWRVLGVNLTVLPAHWSVNQHTDDYYDWRIDAREKTNQNSVEARLSNSTNRLKWVMGTYYINENVDASTYFDQRIGSTLSGRTILYSIPTLITDAWAVFGETTVSLTRRLRVIAGGRYTDEHRSRDGYNFQTNYAAGAVVGTITTPLPGAVESSAVTWRGGLEYDVAARNMLYLTASKGFRGGGFAPSLAETYKPEYVTAYTFGSKNRFLNDTLQANLELYDWEYKDQQFNFVTVTPSGVQVNVLRNAGQARMYGADLDLLWKFTPHDTLDAGIGYLHARYGDFKFNAFGSFVNGATTAIGCISRGPGPDAGTFVQDCSGGKLPRAPLWNGNVRYTHRLDLNDGSSLTFGGIVKFASQTLLQLDYVASSAQQPAYQTYDVDATYRAKSGRWSIQFYGRNLGNTAVYYYTSNSVYPPSTGASRVSSAAIGAPRTFGARLQIDY